MDQIFGSTAPYYFTFLPTSPSPPLPSFITIKQLKQAHKLFCFICKLSGTEVLFPTIFHLPTIIWAGGENKKQTEAQQLVLSMRDHPGQYTQ